MPDDSDRLEHARRAAANAHAPYSGFHVGCAVETRDGRVFTGANMENASYGLSMCAEVGALTAATVAGALGDIARLTVVGGRPASGGRLSGAEPVRPCGRCRQLISEAADLGGRDIEVVSVSGDGRAIERSTISELLPRAFGPTALGTPSPISVAAE